MTICTAIYARTSSDCSLSADEQIECLQAIACRRRWTVVHIFTDRPTSVRKGQDRRPGEVALIDLIRRSAIERLLIWSIDRIGKTLTDLVTFIETCRLAGVAVHLDQQNIDAEGSGGLFDLTEMMALHLRQTRRDRILRGQAAARSLPSGSDDRQSPRPRWRRPRSRSLPARAYGKQRDWRVYRLPQRPA